MQSLATRLQGPDGPPGALLLLKDGYPCLEPLGSQSDATRKLLSAYDMVRAAHTQTYKHTDIQSVIHKHTQMHSHTQTTHTIYSPLSMYCPAHETVPVSLSSFSFSSRQPQALHVLHRGLLQVRSSLESVGFMRVSTGVDQNNSHADTQTHSQTHTPQVSQRHSCPECILRICVCLRWFCRLQTVIPSAKPCLALFIVLEAGCQVCPLPPPPSPSPSSARARR